MHTHLPFGSVLRVSALQSQMKLKRKKKNEGRKKAFCIITRIYPLVYPLFTFNGVNTIFLRLYIIISQSFAADAAAIHLHTK